MSTPADRPFAARVDDALRQVQLVLAGGAEDGLDAGQVAKLNAQVRRFREEVVEVEARRIAPAGFPVVWGMTPREAEGLLGILSRLSAPQVGVLMLCPTPESRAISSALFQRLRAAWNEEGMARLLSVPVPPPESAATAPPAAADAALDVGGAA